MNPNLSDEQKKILFDGQTEAPFSSKLLHEKGEGTYKCANCGNPLFDSTAKFDSGTGWPSFDQALPNAIINIHDESHGMSRIEIKCAKCNAHLGHVFDDGPTPTGKRYCLNGVCLDATQLKN